MASYQHSKTVPPEPQNREKLQSTPNQEVLMEPPPPQVHTPPDRSSLQCCFEFCECLVSCFGLCS